MTTRRHGDAAKGRKKGDSSLYPSLAASPCRRVAASVLVLTFAFCLPAFGQAVLAFNAARRGEALRQKWSLDAAESAFRQALALDAANLTAQLGLSRVARARFDYAAALAWLDKIKSVSAASAASAEVLAEYGAIYLATEDAARAKAFFDDALKIDSANINAIIGRAGTDLLERDAPSAEARLRRWLVGNVDHSQARAMLARVLIESNRYDEAEQEAARAVALDEYNVEALGALCFVKATRREPETVRRLARRILLLDPLNISARRLLSQYVDGRAGLQQDVGKEARLHGERGRALKREGRAAQAVAEFEAALAIHPRYYRALIGLGDIWLRDGDYERAATAARMALAVDADGAAAHLELAYANRGLQERARIEIGGEDFAATFDRRPAPPAYALTRTVFPNYKALTPRQQRVIDWAVAPLADYLPTLARSRARHYLLAFDETVGDVGDFDDLSEEKTFDGRYYASLRGVGGRVTVSGLEYLEMAASGGFHTIAHEFAHQVHMTALGKADALMIRRLFERAKPQGRALDYYAAANEYEYFAQGYEAFISDAKRPSAGVTARHTRRELEARDPELYDFLMKLTRPRRP
ncbi:MAG: tetratricopeptide repeat protein [Blastocatellia bacterium]